MNNIALNYQANSRDMEFLGNDFWSYLTDLERYRTFAEDLGPWAPVMAIAAMVVVSFLPLPAETVAVANGAVFGRLYGFLLTWAGALIAAVIAFAIARTLGQPILNRILPKKTLASFDTKIARPGAPFLLLARMIPFIPYTVVNYGSGLSPVRFRTYLWTSAIGMIPPIFAFVSVGDLMVDQPWIGWVSLAAAIIFFGLVGYYLRGHLAGERELIEE